MRYKDGLKYNFMNIVQANKARITKLVIQKNKMKTKQTTVFNLLKSFHSFYMIHYYLLKVVNVVHNFFQVDLS